jgi:hypothetical protein
MGRRSWKVGLIRAVKGLFWAIPFADFGLMMTEEGAAGRDAGGAFFAGLLVGPFFDPAGWLFFEAGFRPGGRLPFLSRDRSAGHKKGSKEARPELPTTLRFATGRPALGGMRGVPQNSLLAPAAQSVQTTAAS